MGCLQSKKKKEDKAEDVSAEEGELKETKTKKDKKNDKKTEKNTEASESAKKETQEKADKPKEKADKPKEKADKPKDKEKADKPKEKADKPKDKEKADKPKDKEKADKPKEKADKPKEKADKPKEKADKPKSDKKKEKEAEEPKEEPEDKDKAEKDETASEETDRLYKKYMAEVDEHAKLRAKYFDEASKAHDAGDGAKAKELSTKGKEEGRLMEEAQVKAADAIYKAKNKGNEQHIMDLHGLQVKGALAIVEREIAIAKKNSKTAEVIHGKGNHSDKNGPKIKGAVRKWLDENGYKWEEASGGGSVVVTF